MKSIFASIFVLLFSLSLFRAQENADAVLKTSLETAKKENKNVLLFFHASWCGWCKLMEKNMQAESTQAYFSRNFVLASVDVMESEKKKYLENPGGEKLLLKYAGRETGLPFWIILDKDGKILTDSFNEKGENLGSPASPEEVEIFVSKLQKTTAITPEEIAAVKKVFIKEN